MEKEERSGGMFPVDLDRNSARDLLLTEGKKLMLTWEESLDPKTNLKSVCQKILNAGFFSDLEIISNQGVTCRGHKRVLKGKVPASPLIDFADDIEFEFHRLLFKAESKARSQGGRYTIGP